MTSSGERQPARPILIVGLPRSGTTWTAEILASAPGVRYVHEPDNLGVSALAVGLRNGVIEPPALRRGDTGGLGYRRLWDLAGTGRMPSPRTERFLRYILDRGAVPEHVRLSVVRAAARVMGLRRDSPDRVLVKSVAAHLCTEWLADELGADVVLVHRHPLNLVSAWLELGWGSTPWATKGPIRARFETTEAWPPPSDGTARASWESCATQLLLLEAGQRNPSWVVVDHEARCADPLASFQEIARRLGLPWTLGTERALVGSHADATGFTTGRLWEQEAGRWRSRLDADAVRDVQQQISRFAWSGIASRWSRPPG